MKWQQHIVSDKKGLLGKPTIKGTRISVDHLVSLLAQGWTEEKILRNYPHLNPESLQAVFSFLHECMQDGLLFTPVKRSS